MNARIIALLIAGSIAVAIVIWLGERVVDDGHTAQAENTASTQAQYQADLQASQAMQDAVRRADYSCGEVSIAELNHDEAALAPIMTYVDDYLTIHYPNLHEDQRELLVARVRGECMKNGSFGYAVSQAIEQVMEGAAQ